MKKSIFIILLIVTVSCKNSDKQEEVKNPSGTVNEKAETGLSTQLMDEIQLNNGSKWEANIETTEGVEKMQELLKTQTTSSIIEYHLLASKLNDVKNELVKECTMKGASHDNLHLWLYPLIEKINTLSNVDKLNEAAKIKQSVEDNLNNYSTYFQ